MSTAATKLKIYTVDEVTGKYICKADTPKRDTFDNKLQNEIDVAKSSLPQWQKDIIDKNLKEIADNPKCLRPIEELFEELDKED